MYKRTVLVNVIEKANNITVLIELNMLHVLIYKNNVFVGLELHTTLRYQAKLPMLLTLLTNMEQWPRG